MLETESYLNNDSAVYVGIAETFDYVSIVGSSESEVKDMETFTFHMQISLAALKRLKLL